MTKIEQEAFDRLRKTLELSKDIDLYQVLSNANTRINRLTETLNGTYNPEKAEDKNFNDVIREETEANVEHIKNLYKKQIDKK